MAGALVFSAAYQAVREEESKEFHDGRGSSPSFWIGILPRNQISEGKKGKEEKKQ